MSVLDSIASFKTGTYTVTRTAPGSVTLGRYTPGSTSTLSIDAHVQPLTGRELQVLAEGDRANEQRWLFTTTLLHTLDSAVGAPDSVSIDGESWDVARVERWDAFGVSYYRARVARKVRP